MRAARLAVAVAEGFRRTRTGRAHQLAAKSLPTEAWNGGGISLTKLLNREARSQQLPGLRDADEVSCVGA